MSTHEPEAQPHNRPVWMFMAATAMATVISTVAATAMAQASARPPIEVTCECDAPPSPTGPSAPMASTVPAAPDADSQSAPSESAEGTPTSVEVEGLLDKEIIKRVVRAHLGEVRHCYNQGLTDDPALAGRVAVQFTIGSQGSVEQTAVVSTTLENTEVPACIEQAVGRWKFPKPGNAERVTVTYPFVLEPS